MSEPHALSVDIAQTVPTPLNVAFTCAADDLLAVFGPSGSGKTTLLRSIAGLHAPAHATIRCGPETWTDTAAGQPLPARRRRVGYVFQEYALFPHLSVAGNVRAALTDRPAVERQATAARWISATRLTGLESRRPATLSGGERQRVALARALARDPHVLLLDEPFAAVDRSLRETLRDEVDALRRRLRIPVILVTHDLDDVVRLATHVLLLERGRMVALGPIDSLTSQLGIDWARHGLTAGSVLDARVDSLDPIRGLASLTSPAGPLTVALGTLTRHAQVRVRIPAREIILATHHPEGLSLHNVLPARVVDVNRNAAHILVQLQAQDARLLAEVTRDAVDRLALTEGREVFALIKSVSIDVYG